jgi:hypothetical protein
VDEWCETMLFWTSYLLSYLYLICATGTGTMYYYPFSSPEPANSASLG